MSDKIDYIDLTVDSPEVYRSRRRSNTRNLPQSTTLHDSVIEISVDNTCHGDNATDIIGVDLNHINETVRTSIYCINESNDGNLVMLTCPICFEHLPSKLKPMSTPCGHIFCAQCLRLTLRGAKRCPICRKAANFKSCTQLIFS